MGLPWHLSFDLKEMELVSRAWPGGSVLSSKEGARQSLACQCSSLMPREDVLGLVPTAQSRRRRWWSWRFSLWLQKEMLAISGLSWRFILCLKEEVLAAPGSSWRLTLCTLCAGAVPRCLSAGEETLAVSGLPRPFTLRLKGGTGCLSNSVLITKRASGLSWQLGLYIEVEMLAISGS